MEGSKIIIEGVSPEIDCGRWPIKRIEGDTIVVEADIFRDGTGIIEADLLHRRKGKRSFERSPMSEIGNDRWRGGFPVGSLGIYEYTIEAWSNPAATARRDDEKRAAAGLPTEDLASTLPERSGPTRYGKILTVVVEREKARFSTWYEIFPRSYGDEPGRHGTFESASRRLSYIADLGFDVVYLTPIHPIGRTNRKGRNNSLLAGPGDPGSPWAIGSEEGGHDAVHPELGSIDDFDAFVEKARSLDLEVALDIALQASPDHPWLTERPEWFRKAADGSIRFAENPPKKYEDIHPLDFETPDREGLWNEILRIFLFWISHGVKIFRVDNPHTKPFPFWEYLIREIRARHPDVVFLSEAFTRPKVMKALAKVGFSQSYTYFTWRNYKAEIEDYLIELSTPPVSDYLRPNFFVNTPDILSPVLVHGGRPAFMMRYILAATASPSIGIYSGYEICENAPLEEGREEYLDSEKYQLKHRDFDRPGNIRNLVKRVNAIRRENPALRGAANLTVFHSESDSIIAYGRKTRDNLIIAVINLDYSRICESVIHIPPDWSGGGRYDVIDLLTGSRYSWSERNFVRLNPDKMPGHILRIEGVSR